MGSDLIALIVAVMLGAAVVGVGLRRNLGDTTRMWLPRFEGGSEQASVAQGPEAGRRRRRLSPRERRWLIGFNLLIGLSYVAMAALWADDRSLHASMAALFVIAAAVCWRRKPSVS